MKSIWQIQEVSDADVLNLSRELTLPHILARLLWLRGYKTPQACDEFLNYQLKDLPNPFLLKGMDKAVSVITGAVKNHEKIVVYGDYDVDGTISSSLLYLFFKESGYPIDFYIPHRMKEGYSLNAQALQTLKQRGYDVIITVDNGISALKESVLAKELGFKLVITDHHHVPSELPVAEAIVNPQQIDCPFPAKEVCGAGVAFFLMMALRSEWRKIGLFSKGVEPNLGTYLDLVAIATVADVVPLRGVNRLFVKQGLRVLNKTRWPGLMALQNVAKVSAANSFDLGFKLGPRLNACGRLYDAATGVKMLTSTSIESAQKLALELDVANRERRQIEAEILEQAKEKVLEEKSLRHGYVLGDERWHPGVIGIVASRLVEQFHRPFILLGKDGDHLKGSARSLPSLSMIDALNACADLLTKFGGHKAAAGMSLLKSNLKSFESAFNDYVKNHLGESDFIPKLKIDALLSLNEINEEFFKRLSLLEPFGMGNPEPLFMSESVAIKSKQIVGDKHLKLKVGESFQPAIAFNRGELLGKLSNSSDIAYQIGWDNWAHSPNLVIKDFQII